ncbi:hypothetical protein [Acetobacterium bakii]|uniref:Transcriptional regulator n=1 Tax=Acetobacterium bakii TaxID=52689 RepID=A0A0L6TYR5_9FIRM|nr:hypothetical protein [Acetobacterium bakii]KNZ41378.1 hypothetical protein AKG39_12210 [Acetobacterium bakii]
MINERNDLLAEIANVVDIAQNHVYVHKCELGKKVDVSKIAQAYANGQEPDEESSLYMDLELSSGLLGDADHDFPIA